MMNAEKREAHRKSQAAWRGRNPEKARAATAKCEAGNPEKVKARKARWVVENPERYLLIAARGRAKRFDVPFSITVKDIIIPEKCPALGTPFKKGTPQAASLDRIVPVLGYVPGNVQVISRRANSIKHNANSKELQAVCDWLRNVEKS